MSALPYLGARLRAGSAEFVQAEGFLAAGYVHRSSRAGDPQLHTHVLVANATKGPDGRWSRLHHPSLYEHANTASYVYQAHLRHELTRRLGVEWKPVEKGIADIRGFSGKQLRHFSTRRAEILEAAGAGASAREMQIATLETRDAKDRDISDESLRETWRIKGEEVGLDRETIEAWLGRERPGETILTAEQVGRSATAHVSHFDRREAIQVVADNLPHGAPAWKVEELADEFLAHESVGRIASNPRGDRFTTRRIWELERTALSTAGEMVPIGDRGAVDPIVSRRVLDARPSLKSDQGAMVERLLGDGRGLEVVIGEAGTGKTYATVATAEGWRAAHKKVVAAAPTWRAANVLRAEGLEAMSVARLLALLDNGGSYGEPALRPGAVLLVDEAGMVDSGTLARLIDHAQAAEAKLVLIGDPAQLGEIEAGGLFASIASRFEPIRLNEVIRHNHELDREGAKLIREGRGSEAVGRYLNEGRVHVCPDAQERREAMVRDWFEAKDGGSDALMVAKLNREREALNEMARGAMREAGRLGEEELIVGGRPFAVGDEVITRVNDQRLQIYNRERWRVEAVEVESGRLRLAGIDTPRRVGVDPGYLERVNPSDGAAALEYGYAATVYQAQGATVDTAFVMADPSMDRQEFYVAASRSREETFFYATPEPGGERIEIAPDGRSWDIGQIARAAERDGAQSSAHDAALRERLSPLSTEELHARRHELRSEAGDEANLQRDWDSVEERLAEAKERLAEVEAGWERLGPKPGRFAPRAERDAYVRDHNDLVFRERSQRERIESLEAQRAALDPLAHDARAETAVIDHLVGERLGAKLTAARLDPPAYVTAELGERPTDPARTARLGQGRRRDRALSRRARDSGHQERPGARAGEGAGFGRRPLTGRGENPARPRGVAGTASRTAAATGAGQRPGGRARRRPLDGDRTMRTRNGNRQTENGVDAGLLAQPLLTADEAARLLHVPRSTVYELVRSRGLPHVRIGERGMRFTRTDLERWVNENTFGR